MKITNPMLIILMMLTGIALKAQRPDDSTLIDPVCGKHVNKSESYDWKYAGKIYSFDSYACLQVFKMNPQNVLLKKCVPDMTAIDPVCGMKVNKQECYDLTFQKSRYYFCSYECRETFKVNPPKFTSKKCIVADSIQTGKR